tara:strand:+ start:269 stop:469 length:201 start_codon:yes stop_codon:yes gene_type:complete
MSTKEEQRQITLDHMIDERFAEIFFLAKDEFHIESNTPAEEELYERLEEFKGDIKHFCQKNYGAHL